MTIRLMHVITGLERGGAEMMLYKLLFAMDRGQFSNYVVSLTDEGNVGAMIQALGIPVVAMDMGRGAPSPRTLLRLAGLMRREKIQLAQCWMYHANLVGGLSSRLAGVPVLWNIRQSNFDTATSKRSTIRVMKWCARLSTIIPSKIVACSGTASGAHQGYGYDQGRMVVIPNGFQTDLYRPDEHVRARIRLALGIAARSIVVGVVGRFDPQKDHQLFVQAAGRVVNKIKDVHFLFCGDGLSRDNPQLMGWIRTEGIEGRCLLLGRRDDLHELYCAMDVMVSSSAYGEGFPNVIGEAMSCGVPCVVTDVGDSAIIVGDMGRVVSPRDLDALAGAINEIAALSFDERKIIGAAARRRILEQYDLPSIASRYMALYKDVVARCAA